MKKSILLIMALMVGFVGFSQKNLPLAKEKTKLKKLIPYKDYGFRYTKAIGDTIWYNDFSNASEWTMYHTGGTGDWVIQNTDDPNAGYGTGTIHSTTWQNGYAIYDADLYGSDQTGEDAYIEYTGTIDLSSYTTVAIVFQQKYRKWQSTKMYVEVSTNGTTWDSIEVNVTTPTSVLDTMPEIVNISNFAAGQSNVHIRFHYHGGWDYSWCIDDIAIIEAPEYDLVGESFHVSFLGGGWYSAIYTNERTFFKRVDAYIYNNGVNAVNPLLNVTLLKDGNTVFTKTSDSTTTMQPLNPNTRDTVFWNTIYDTTGIGYEPLFLDTTGNYTYEFQMAVNIADNGVTDGVPENNVPANQYVINVNDSMMARATTLSRLLSVASYSGAANGDFIGTVYYLPNPDTFKAISLYLQSNTNAGEYAGEVQPVVYQYDFQSGDWSEKLSGDPVDVSTLGEGTYFTLTFNSDGFSELFEGGNFYAVGVKQFIDPNTQYIGIGCDNVFPHDYANEDLITVGGTFYYTSAGVPDIRLMFKTTTTAVETVEANSLNIYPNPATTTLYVENNAGASIHIYNLLGEEVKVINNADRNAVVNVADLNEGTYIVKVIDGNKVKTAKVNIVK